MKTLLTIAISICLSATFSPRSVGATTLVIDSATNQLLGATGVDVGGTLYDVQFLDGTFNDIYNNGLALLFHDSTSALAASQALMDQVIIGIYDSDPSLVNGITTADFETDILTPYATNGTNAIVAAAINSSNEINDGWADGGIIPADVDMTSLSFITFALWQPHLTTVPEPTTIFLLGAGLIGLVAFRKR